VLNPSSDTSEARPRLAGAPSAADMPRISIIVASLDAGRLIGRCLESVVLCGYPAVEVIVADGGSRDDTLGGLRAVKSRMGERLSWISEPDAGIADAWNKAITRAKGDWLLFLGADDTIASPTVLARMALHLQRALPHHRVVYGQIAMVDHRGHVLRLME